MGEKVLAGTANLDGQLDARVLGTIETWVISHLSEQYKKSASFRPKLAVLADVVARYFVAIILILTMLTGLYWWTQGADNYFAIALAVLVVSCPCALLLATPVAYTIASGAVRKLGLLVSEGSFLEKLSAVNAVVFDKTGTLTEGTLKLEQTIPLSEEFSLDQLLQIAASLEVTSLHPVAATLRAETNEILDVKNLEISPGFGVSGQIGETRYWLGKPTFALNTDIEAPSADYNWVLLAQSNTPLCWFGFSDRLREGAETVIEQTKARVSQVDVFSGDKSDAGRDRVRSLGIALPSMDKTPEQKIEGLRNLHHQGKTVLMVGDGLNDAGAMAASDISIAINPVDTVVQSAADATLVNGDLSSLPELFDYAIRVKHVIRQNLIWAFAYNLSVIPLAMAGVIAPWAAALGMSASSLLVTLNACRLARTR